MQTDRYDFDSGEKDYPSDLLRAGLTYPLRPNPGANPTGRFANKPMRKLHRAEMAAVEVMRSWRTSSTQARYV